MQNWKINTASGALDIISLKEFVSRIPMELVQSSQVHIPIIKSPTFTSISSLDMSYGPIIEDHVVRLDRFGLLDEHGIKGMSHQNVAELINRYCLKGVMEEFNTIIAKKQSHLTIKDLSVEVMHELSIEYLKRFGHASCGIEMNLSKYQTFFIVANPEDFKFFYMTPQVSNGALQLLGKLIDLQNDRWVMARYQDNTWRAETASLRHYNG